MTAVAVRYNILINIFVHELKIALKHSVSIRSPMVSFCSTGGKINARKAVNYVPIVGSVDIMFDGTGLYTVQNDPVGAVLAGTLHLFMNGNWTIVERGMLSTPIVYVSVTNPELVSLQGPIPVEITDYITQADKGPVTGVLSLCIPTKTAPGSSYYYLHMFSSES